MEQGHKTMPRSGSGRAEEGLALVVGFARTGRALARALVRRGRVTVVVDDAPSTDAPAIAASIGVALEAAPSPERLAELVDKSTLIVVSPGVPPTHPLFALAGGRVVSEIEYAARLFDRPIVAVTGTNGKTTVTALVAEMLLADGRRARAVGNIGEPLIDFVDDPDLDVAVCEASSFQLAYTERFRPDVGTWLNLAEDHLDWHRDLADYVAAKSRIWAAQRPGDVAVANREDAVVMGQAREAPGRLVTFARQGADYRIEAGRFVGPDGADFGAIDALGRSFPHDQLNALAAIATAHQAGASPHACALALEGFRPSEHRVELVASLGDVEFYDDSKATTPSAVIAALAGFSSVVLIAGGRNKGLDLGAIARAIEQAGAPAVSGVVAIGDAASEVVEAFADFRVEPAGSMREAVTIAASLARPGDAVLLSPGCASFDWYRDYEARGRDFAELARALPGAVAR